VEDLALTVVVQVEVLALRVAVQVGAFVEEVHGVDLPLMEVALKEVLVAVVLLEVDHPLVEDHRNIQVEDPTLVVVASVVAILDPQVVALEVAFSLVVSLEVVVHLEVHRVVVLSNVLQEEVVVDHVVVHLVVVTTVEVFLADLHLQDDAVALRHLRYDSELSAMWTT